jgi:peptidoglycan/LPS O-acetylase OafA/YrhL
MQPKEVRFSELDAVRGFAALSVLVYHYVTMWRPSEAFDQGWKCFLYPLLAGHEAVLLFFLLSGLALSKMLSGRQTSYQRYAARRVIRIYGPYLIALLLSIAGAAVWHNQADFGRWKNTWSQPIDWSVVLQHILFLGHYDPGQYNLSFWSLVHELRISLLFPLLYTAIKRMRPAVVLPIAIGSSMFAYARAEEHTRMHDLWITVSFIGIFAVGVLIAENAQAISQWFRGLARFTRVLFGLVSFALYFEGHRLRSAPAVWRFQEWPIVAGSAGLIVVAMNSVSIKRFLQTEVPQFLGRISYSLYLVHAAVLFALTAMLWGKIPSLYFGSLYVLSALLIGTLFNRLVEQRFVALSRSVTAKRSKDEVMV